MVTSDLMSHRAGIDGEGEKCRFVVVQYLIERMARFEIRAFKTLCVHAKLAGKRTRGPYVTTFVASNHLERGAERSWETEAAIGREDAREHLADARVEPRNARHMSAQLTTLEAREKSARRCRGSSRHDSGEIRSFGQQSAMPCLVCLDRPQGAARMVGGGPWKPARDAAEGGFGGLLSGTQ
jgi:hypothetical protein